MLLTLYDQFVANENVVKTEHKRFSTFFSAPNEIA